MSEPKPLALAPDDYHTLSVYERDHLLAAALLNAKRDSLPARVTVTETVGEITGGRISPPTTGKALDRLEDAGLIERVDGAPVGGARGVRVTEDGARVLARGAARLDAAAAVQ